MDDRMGPPSWKTKRHNMDIRSAGDEVKFGGSIPHVKMGTRSHQLRKRTGTFLSLSAQARETKMRLSALVGFGLLYVAQGAVLNYNTALLDTFFQLSFDTINWVSTLAIIPLALGILFGVVSDRWSLQGRGHRRPYVIVGLIVCLGGVVCVSLIDAVAPEATVTGSGALRVLMVGLSFIYVAGLSMFNAVTDGWGIDISRNERHESLVQAYMIGGKSLGTIAVAVIFEINTPIGRFFPAVMLSALVSVPLIYVWIATEEPKRPSVPHSAFVLEALKLFVQPKLFFVLLSGAIGSLTFTAVAIVSKELAITHTLGTMHQVAQAIGTLLGAIFGQDLVRRYTYMKAYPVSAVSMLVVTLLQAVVPPSAASLWTWAILFGLSEGMFRACFFALSMGMCRKTTAATNFAFIILVAYIGGALSEAFAVTLLTQVGSVWTFVILTLASAINLPIIWAMFYSSRVRQFLKRETPLSDTAQRRPSNALGADFYDADGLEPVVVQDLDDDAPKLPAAPVGPPPPVRRTNTWATIVPSRNVLMGSTRRSSQPLGPLAFEHGDHPFATTENTPGFRTRIAPPPPMTAKPNRIISSSVMP